MDRLAPLSQQQRLDYQVLVNRGVPEAQARAIAQGYQLAKADGGRPEPGEAYYKAFFLASRRLLPEWQHGMLHKTARGKAGAAGAARKRDGKAGLLGELEALGKRMAELHAEIGKSSPLASEVHVPAPPDGERRRFEVIKAGDFEESKHPRSDNGQFGSGGSSGGSGDKPKAKESKKTPFASMGSAEHVAAAKASMKTADKHAAAGKSELAASHRAQADKHLQAAKEHREAAAQAPPMTKARYGEIYGKVANAFIQGGNAAGNAALAELPVHEREQVSQVQRGITRLERAEDRANKNVTKSLSARELAYIKAAFGLQQPTEAPVPDAPDGTAPPELEALMQANRLVAGMDAELRGGAASPEDARRRASRVLLERPGHYDGVGAEPDVRPMRGLMLDIGCGQARAPGHLGLDLFPYDHGTVLHDVELGLPFPDGSARAIRLEDSLHAILDAPGARPDPIPLLAECQRVLAEGGCLYYDGPEPLLEEGQRWPLPGLVLLRTQGTAQVLRRVPLRVPAYHGADADFAPAGPLPLDMQMALAAANTSPAETAMANLVRKSLAKVVPIAKADKMRQIISGVILSPHEADLQDDVISPEEIERSAHEYMLRSRIVGSEHGKPIDAGVVESYIAPQDLQFTGLDGDNTFVAKGSWVMSVKVTDPAEWAQVLAGEYTGFSVGGYGEREPLEAAA